MRQGGKGLKMTIKDVAAKSGVSISTVSRVLNDHPDVSEDVRRRVMETVRELHYVPNSAARDLVRTQTNAIGVVVRGAENPFFTRVIRAIEQSCSAEGYIMALHQIPAGGDELQAAAELVRSKRLKGLILLGGRFDYSESEIGDLGVPFVCCTYTNSFGTLGRESYSSVSIDDEAEAYKAVSLLTGRGHRKIAILLDSADGRSISELRYRGYVRALKDAGIEPDPGLVIETGDFTMEAAYGMAGSRLESRPDITAIFAIADSFAIAAIKAAADRGLKVPEDCSVMAIDGIEMSLYTVPTLTTLVQPQALMGSQAVEILTDIISGRGGHRHLRLETDLREGQSVAAPKES